ncbi:MAG: hypothetical protein OER88_03570, partial [Planctomycetota bacterium]|nr:hypothetical protein [Planctomycetota bacterium]
MNALDLVSVLLSAGLDQQLRGGPRLEPAVFRGVIEPPARLRFAVGDDKLDWDDWTRALAGRPASRAVLTATPPAASAQVGEHEVPQRMLAGFAGPSTLLVAVQVPGEVDVYRPSVGYPPRTLVGNDDIFAFVESFPRRDELRESLLWQA